MVGYLHTVEDKPAIDSFDLPVRDKGYLPAPPRKRVRKTINPYKLHGRAVISDDVVRQVRKLREEGKTIKQIAEATGQKTPWIRDVLNGVLRSNVK